MPNHNRLRDWLDQGLAAHRRGDVAQAVAAYRQALLLDPEDADALNLLGTGLLQMGDAVTAVAHLERAVRRQRSNSGAFSNLAQAYLALERPADAEAAFRKASRIAPQEPNFQLGLAAALALQGKLAEARALLERLAARVPASAPVWFNLGNVLRDSKAVEEAIAAYRKAIERDPQFADAINSLGSVYQSTLRFALAEEHYRKCLAVAPDHLLARYNLASVVMDLGRFVEAEALCRELIARAPEMATGYSILGAALGHQGRLLDALASHERAAALAPDDPKTAENYAAALMEAGHAAPGLAWFARALASSPEADAPRQLLGIALLAHGYLQEGWVHYGRRPAALRFREKYPALDLTRTLPRDLAGRHVCVLREQGLGDEIFFLRYAAVLAARGARVTYRSSEKIASLLARLPFIDVSVAEVGQLPPADANILLGDLPHALDAPAENTPPPALADLADRVAAFSAPVPPSIEVPPLAARVRELRETLSRLGPPPYIGVTWRAGTLPEEQNSATWLLYKTIGVTTLARVMGGVQGTIVALQRRPAAGEIEAFSAALGRPVHDLTALNEDLEGMLALLALLDDYVAVSNTNVHLRACVGKTARVLVPVPAEWRWTQAGRDSPWFPGFRIYLQSLQGDWREALAELARDLELTYGPAAPSNST